MADESEREPLPSPPSSSNWSHKLITVFGWSFDFFTVAVSITDVISDLLVAVQFLRDGHTLWAWLVFGAFINSSIVYYIVLTSTVFHKHNEAFMIGCDHIIKERYREWPWLLRFLMVLPFSQLAPAGTYMFHTFIMPHWRKTAIRRSGLSDLRGKTHKLLGGQTAVHREEADAVQGTFTVVGRLQDAVKRQVVTHGMLFAETIVESIPQSIIQLLAITFLGAPSTLQV
ncbi:transmembrane protein, putative, partial [Bodo saltans]